MHILLPNILHPSASDLPRILFMHIPKSAGMSLFNALKDLYGEERTLRYADVGPRNRKLYLSMDYEETRKFHFITGHLTLPLFMNKPLRDFKVITIVRNPVDRELSAYFYIKSWTEHPHHKQFKNSDLYQFLDHQEKNDVKDLQCWFLSETRSFEKARDMLGEYVDLAAPLDYLKEFLQALNQFYGMPPLNLKRENETAFRLSSAELHPDIIDRFRALTREDQKLYDYVKHEFETKIKPQLVLNPTIDKPEHPDKNSEK